ncbi:response regulator transcription factor [Chitinibacter fontanus]|uniref:Response regulator transcription factor n=1 Tax=Chitinibacter fontanus TaxID=1737446 RepID=A0A7D5ZA70_9NEIS|nr:LuxR C-terminal-related transcriptional regulator [Chitinibacter fontanus]QLI81005.1 response regulator transcription factor [Chitinibacter fontanus]
MLTNFVIASRNAPLIERWRGLNLPSAQQTICSRWSELSQREWPSASLCVLDLALCEAEPSFPDLHPLSARVCLCLFAAEFQIQDELRWLASGVRACCTPELEDERLKVIVDVTVKGGIWVSNQSLPMLLQGLQRFAVPSSTSASKVAESCLNVLTPQERKIAQLVGQGESNKLIARALNISDHTVKTHLSAIFSKLHLNDRVHLALLVNQDVSSSAS